MKRIAFALSALLLSITLAAQTTQDEFQKRYELLSGRLGPGGVGIETLINKWEAAFPDDCNMLEAKYSYYISKCTSSKVIKLSQDKYLGNDPILPMKDSTGVAQNFFEDLEYNDSLFTLAVKSLDKAISLRPKRLDYRLAKVSSYIGYEKECPDMAMQDLKAIIDYNYSSKPTWEYPGINPVDNEAFCSLIQDYCYSFFRIGSAQSAEAFRDLSEKMLSFNPNQPLYLDNMGSYYLVFQKDSKKALKYYNKVLKKHPDDITAIRNCVVLARKDKNVKLEKKYLEMMVRYARAESDRLSAEGRLTVLNSQKK